MLKDQSLSFDDYLFKLSSKEHFLQKINNLQLN